MKKLTQDEIVYTCRAMSAYGGSFANYIAAAAQVADMSNSARIQLAFPELFEKYGPGSDFYEAVTRKES